MATRLKNIITDEISLVDRAAVRDPRNPKQPMRFLFWKSADGNKSGAVNNDNQMEVTQGMPIQENVLKALSVDMPGELTQKLDKMLADANIKDENDITMLKSAATLAYARAQKAEDAVNVVAGLIGKNDGNGKDKGPGQDTAKNDKPDTAKVDDGVKKGDDGDVADDKKNVVKAQVDPNVVAALEKAEADNRQLAARLAKAEELLQKAEEERLTAQFVAKADSYGILGVDKNEFGAVLKDIYKAAPEAYGKLETFLETFKEVAKKSDVLMKEIGQTGPGSSSDALSRLQAAAAELRKADSKLTKEQAFAKAMEENPDLYQEYVRETYLGGDK